MTNPFRRPFGKANPINASTAKIDEQVYLMNYARHYAGILGDRATKRQLAELFLFRAWVAQFGFRIFSTDREASERLIGETVNAAKYLGLAVFHKTHGFSVEETLGNTFIELIEDRWQSYDAVVISMRSIESRIPTIAIVDALCNRLGIRDPLVTYRLSAEFAMQLETIKQTASDIGLLK